MKFKKIITLLGLLALTTVYAQAQKFNMLIGTYTTTTKPNGIFVYEFDTQIGKATLLGKSSRTFTIDPTGNYLIVTNSATNEVVFFKRDQKTGLIKPTGEKLAIDKPGIVKFAKI